MKRNRITFLFEKALGQTISDEERVELFHLLEESGQDELAKKLFEKGWLVFEDKNTFFSPDESDRMINHVLGRKTVLPVKRSFRRYLQWAAMLILGLSICFYMYLRPLGNHGKMFGLAQKTAIKPGGNKATLVLANGRELDLDDMENQITEIDGVSIHKNEEGQLVYQIDATDFSVEEVKENVLTTPKGGQFQLILPDGTKAWLSASSSLRYPTRFVGKSRSVTLTGEAYFEVAKNQSMPFDVQVEGATIQVLGTNFLVNAYEDEAETKTTLFDGKVSIASRHEGKASRRQQVLQPGEQATLNRITNNLVVRKVDVTDALALKMGYFVFQNEDIQTVMSTIARWYDVEIVYAGDVSGETFIGTVSKFDSIEKLLKTIELTGGVHFKIEGRNVLVMK